MHRLQGVYLPVMAERALVDIALRVHDQARIEFIAARVRRMASELGGQPDVLEATYRTLMDASIAFEHREFARLREGAAA